MNISPINRSHVAKKRTQQILNRIKNRKNGIKTLNLILGNKSVNSIKPKVLDRIIKQYDNLVGYEIEKGRQAALAIFYIYVDDNCRRTINDEEITDTILIYEVQVRKPKEKFEVSIIYTYHTIKRMMERCEGYLHKTDEELIETIQHMSETINRAFQKVEAVNGKLEEKYDTYYVDNDIIYKIIFKICRSPLGGYDPLVSTVYPIGTTEEISKEIDNNENHYLLEHLCLSEDEYI